MIDRIFTLTLALAIMAGGTLAIFGEFVGSPNAAQPSQAVAELPRVVITGSVERSQTDIARADNPAADERSEQRIQ